MRTKRSTSVVGIRIFTPLPGFWPRLRPDLISPRRTSARIVFSEWPVRAANSLTVMNSLIDRTSVADQRGVEVVDAESLREVVHVEGLHIEGLADLAVVEPGCVVLRAKLEPAVGGAVSACPPLVLIHHLILGPRPAGADLLAESDILLGQQTAHLRPRGALHAGEVVNRGQVVVFCDEFLVVLQCGCRCLE